MSKTAILFVYILLILSVSCLACNITPPEYFDYASEQLNNLDIVKQEYGQKPLETIKPILTDENCDYSVWRRAVAAVAFTGEDGAALLLINLEPRLKLRLFDKKSEALLYTLGCIYDHRTLDVSLSVLESDTPIPLKCIAADNIYKLAEQTSWSAQKTVRCPDGTVLSIMSGSETVYCTARPTYSSGQAINQDMMKPVRDRLAQLIQTTADNKDTQVFYKKIQSVVDLIDSREKALADFLYCQEPQ